MGARVYKEQGRAYPSSTTITGQLDKSGPLTWWAAGCASDYVLEKLKGFKESRVEILAVVEIAQEARKQFRSVSNQAKDIGTAVHKAIEMYLKTGREPKIDDDEILAGFVAFLEWADKHKLEVIPGGMELTLFGENYAGTTDLICRLEFPDSPGERKRFVVDFKTSKKPKNGKPYEEWGYQVASYRHAAELNGWEIQGHGVLRLDKESGYPDWHDLSKDFEKDLEVFQALTRVWWLRNP